MVSLSDRSIDDEPTARGRPDEAPAWPVWLFRVVVTLEAVLAVNQAVFAGQFIGGDFAAVKSHEVNASVTGLMLLIEVIAALLLWRPGRRPGWPVLAALGLFLLAGAQTGLGYARILALHVPLGVAIIALDLAMLSWAWRRVSGKGRGGAWTDERRLTDPAQVPAHDERVRAERAR
jgi:hypothetical protein